MQYVCDAPKGKTWFRIETEGEAAHESRLMRHTVEKYFCREREKAVQSWRPERPNAIERDIGLEAHVQREMPLFLTLRDREGNALATAMLPPGGKDRGGFRIIIVAASNADPYPEQDAAIAASLTAAKEPDKYRCLIGAMSAHDPQPTSGGSRKYYRWFRSSKLPQG